MGQLSPKEGSNPRSEGSVEQVDQVTTSIFICSPPNSTAASLGALTTGGTDHWVSRHLFVGKTSH